MKKRSANIRAKLLPVGAFCLIVLIWWGLSASGIIPGYMLPSPADVVGAFIHDFPNLMHHAFVSVTEALLGLLIGTAFAFGLACVMERFLTLEQAVTLLVRICGEG